MPIWQLTIWQLNIFFVPLSQKEAMKIENPFYFGRMVGGNAFTDREKDLQRLIANFRNGISMVLISPRRWGKSSLVQKAAETFK